MTTEEIMTLVRQYGTSMWLEGADCERGEANQAQADRSSALFTSIEAEIGRSMAAEYWTVGHDYDLRLPDGLEVYGVAYATEELAAEAARRLLRYLVWQGYGDKPTYIEYASGYGGRKPVQEWSHEWGRTRDRVCSFTESRNEGMVTLDYKLESREEHLCVLTREVEHGGEVYTRKVEDLRCGPWGKLLGRAYGEEWQHVGGELYAYISRTEITTELPDLG